MDIVNHDTSESQSVTSTATDFIESESIDAGNVAARSKTSLRMHYEANVDVIKRQIGDLDEVQSRLGLSARKLCQLLLVDPSAWTRWRKEGAPPHIWRALQWYFVMNEKVPGLTPQYFIGKDPQVLHNATMQKVDALRTQLESENEALKQQNADLAKKMLGLESAVRANKFTALMLGGATLLMAWALFKFMRGS